MNIPRFTGNLETAAAALGVGRDALRRLRADTRFPVRTADGWPVMRIGALIVLTRFEAMPEDERLAECVDDDEVELFEDMLARG